MAANHEEWLRQADYDMDTAEYMLRGGRNFYAVFMCHLSIEKAIKGLYHFRLEQVPPKIHNLTYLLDKTGCEAPEDTYRFLLRLNEACVATRYPDDIAKLRDTYDHQTTAELLERAKRALEWIRRQF